MPSRRSSASAPPVTKAAPPPSAATPNAPVLRTEPTHAQVLELLDRAQALAQKAMVAGHHPFGALLVAPDHATVLLEQGNVDSVNHAEAVLAREAARRFPRDALWGCTLVTTVEPCAMCAGTQYWAHIGRTVYGIAEKTLLDITGSHPENPTLDLPCRHVFAHGQKDVRVIGPVAEREEPIAAMHRRYWKSR